MFLYAFATYFLKPFEMPLRRVRFSPPQTMMYSNLTNGLTQHAGTHTGMTADSCSERFHKIYVEAPAMKSFSSEVTDCQ